MEEIWKDVIGFEFYYQISNKGNLRGIDRFINRNSKGIVLINGLIKKPRLTKDGYLTINLCSKSKSISIRIHRLVAIHFLPAIFGKTQVNHKNGIKTDNRVENLEWCTVQENNIHAKENGLILSGVNNGRAKLTLENIDYILKNFPYKSAISLAKMFNVNRKTIYSTIKKGQAIKRLS